MSSLTDASKASPCASCGKPNAAKTCSACKDAPGPHGITPQKTSYCNRTCQQAHWPTHKPTCKAHQTRKVLFRAGETAQKVFYMYRSVVFEHRIERVEFKGEDIVIHQGRYEVPETLTPDELLQKCIVAFPEELFKARRDREAVLTYLSCHYSVACMHELVKGLLKGLIRKIADERENKTKGTYTSIEELRVRPKNRKRNITLVYANGTKGPDDHSHELLKVTLAGGAGTYAFDIAAAQFGHYDSVVPWAEYVDTRVGEVLATLEFGRTTAEVLSLKNCREPGWAGPLCTVNRFYCSRMNNSLKALPDGLALDRLVRLGEEEFLGERDSLVRTLEGYLETFKEVVRGDPGRMMGVLEYVEEHGEWSGERGVRRERPRGL